MHPPQTIRAVLRGVVIGFASLAALALLAALLTIEENWRARRDLNRYERELGEHGEKLDMTTFVPPPIPDDENFAMAPLIAPLAKATQEEIAQKPKRPDSPLARIEKLDLLPPDKSQRMPASGNYETDETSDLVAWQRYLQDDPAQNSANDTREAARAILAWLTRWSPELEEISTAAGRPYGRFPINYDKGIALHLPHLSFLLRVAPVYRLRGSAALEGDNVTLGLRDVETLNKLQAAISTEPILVSYLVRIALIKMMLQPIWEGCVNHRWTDAQLREIEAMLAKDDLIADYARVIRGERVFSNLTFNQFRQEHRRFNSVLSNYSWLETPRNTWIYALFPNEAIMCRNQLANERWVQNELLPVVDAAAHQIFPAKQREAAQGIDELSAFPYSVLLKLTAPIVVSFPIRAATTQVAIDQARVACALERFRLQRGRVPNQLDELVPDYGISVLRDVIDGKPLRYALQAGGTYLIYSIGWNETDDGGALVTKRDAPKGRDNERGDWIWFGSKRQ